MIKNQLYPYVEKYINEYLYGFSKEQLDVGVMNGVILLEKLNIRPDKANEKLDKQDSPIWLKAGLIRKINVCCSLMNFIGEKPLEVEIDEIEVLLCPSFRWVLRNKASFLEEDDETIKQDYDVNDNNSKSIFARKVHIFDGSIFRKKQKLLEFLKDTSKISEVIHKLFTKAMKFYYQNNYFINVKINKVHIRFEDDTFNFFGGTIFGANIECIELGLSAESKLKKDNFKFTNLSVYHEEVKSIDNFIISSNLFLSKLKNNIIEEDYYNIIYEVYDNFRDKNKQANNKSADKESSPAKVGFRPSYLTGTMKINKVFLVENLNFMGRLSIQKEKDGDLFANKTDKPYKLCLNIFTNDIKVTINPTIIGKLNSFQDFIKGYFLNDPIQDNKPMRKPYDPTNINVLKNQQNLTLLNKRKLVVRDWWFYFIWFIRFKHAIYGKPFKNKLQEEFSKYFNICCANQSDIFTQEFEVNIKSADFDDKKLNDSILLKKEKTKERKDKPTEDKGDKEKILEEENLNPENIKLHLNVEINIKSVTITLLEDSPSKAISKSIEKSESIIDNMLNTNTNGNIGGNLLKNVANILGKKPNSISIKVDTAELRLNSNFKDLVEVSTNLKQVTIFNSIGSEIQRIEISQSMENSLNLEEREKRGNVRNQSILGAHNNFQGK